MQCLARYRRQPVQSFAHSTPAPTMIRIIRFAGERRKFRRFLFFILPRPCTDRFPIRTAMTSRFITVRRHSLIDPNVFPDNVHPNHLHISFRAPYVHSESVLCRVRWRRIKPEDSDTRPAFEPPLS